MIVKSKRGKIQLLVLLFSTLLWIQSYWIEREQFLLLLSCVAGLFTAYYYLYQVYSEAKHESLFWILAILFHLIPFFAEPPLSNDYYRFLWDGELAHMGINPYDFQPNELIERAGFKYNTYLQELYRGMGDLSQENYSCYPVFNQLYFYVSTSFSSSVFLNLLVLRFLIVGSLFIGFIYLHKLLVLANLPSQLKWLYILNPLLLIEANQNLHFEGVMLSFLLLALYHLARDQFFLGALFFTLAIQLKLIPLILLPFLLRWLGWVKSIYAWTIVLVSSVLVSLILLNNSNYLHFAQSLTLYFKQFEFNSFILHWYIEYGRWQYGYNRIQSFGPFLSRLATGLVLIFAWLGDNFSIQKTLSRMAFALCCYYLLASTVHPWYVLTPMLLSLFSNYRFLFVWSFLVFLSYSSYANDFQNNYRLLMVLEYIGLVSYLVYELYKYKAFRHYLSKE